MGLLVGDVSSVVDVNPEAVKHLKSLVEGSSIAVSLSAVSEAEKRLATAQQQLRAAKKALGRAMMG